MVNEILDREDPKWALIHAEVSTPIDSTYSQFIYMSLSILNVKSNIHAMMV